MFTNKGRTSTASKVLSVSAIALCLAVVTGARADLIDATARARMDAEARLNQSDNQLWVNVKVLDLLDRPIARAKVEVKVGSGVAMWKGYTNMEGMATGDLLVGRTSAAEGQTVDVMVDHYRYLKNGVSVKLPADTLVSRLDFVIRLPRNAREQASMQPSERSRAACEGLGTIVSSPGQIYVGMADAYNRNGPVAAVVVGPIQGTVDMTTNIFRGLGDFLSSPWRNNK